MESIKPQATVTQAGTVTQHATVLPPEERFVLTPESLLFFCQSRLRKMDDAIAAKMGDQKNLVALQGMVGDIAASLKTGGKGGENQTAFDDPDKITELSNKLAAAIRAAEDSGNPEAAAMLRKVDEKLHANNDNIVGVDELKEMSGMLDSASSTCRSGAEVSMIELQSLVSQRSTVLQLTTGMMNSINEGAKSIAANIGRG